MMRAVLFVRAMVDACWFHITREPRKHAVILLGVVALLILSYLFLIPAKSFPQHSLITVSEGESFVALAASLEQDHYVRSSFALRVLARLTGTDDTVNAGRYLVEEPIGSLHLLLRLAAGDHGIPTVRVTLPEGTAAYEMSQLLQAKIAGFNASGFNAQTKSLEGYLFPDTYDFFADATVQEIIERMRTNFNERTKELQEEARMQGVDFNNIVIMASIIEEEANTEVDRHIVSGILWSRIEEDVALQVDATFGYIRGISGYVPTGDDPELESPYNTYLNRGLPPGPITNPGLDAMDAALHPTATDYFYYLTGKDGKMYYAKSFEEHKRNRELYLD